jgi:hypothetical protein
MSDNKDDIAKLTEALRKERAEHKTAQWLLKEAKAKISELSALGALPAAPNAAQIAEHINAAVKAQVALQTVEQNAKIQSLESKFQNANAESERLNVTLASRTVSEAVRDAATAAHVLPNAMADIQTLAGLELKLGADGVPVTEDGRDVATYIDDLRATRGYMWPANVGAGLRGSRDAPMSRGGENPFLPGSFNLTKQGELMQRNPAHAGRLQQEALAMSRQ